MRRIKHKIHDQFRIGAPFKREFRRQMRLLIIVTIGFTIAFVWREAIFTVFKSLITIFFGQQTPVISDILTASLITLIGIIIITITSTFLQEKPYL